MNSSFIHPPLLSAGDTVGIIAPGRKLNSDILDQAIAIIKSWNVQVQLGSNIFSDRHAYLSGTDEERKSDLQHLLNDPTVKCIICARGGYGSTRFVDRLDFMAAQKNPKWLVGFSDVTALHLRFLSEGIPSIHGTMPVLFPKPETESSIESLRKILFEGICVINAKASPENRTGIAEGMVVGGNLSLITESLGTKTEIRTDNRILVIEEVDEYYYRLDRMMNQLYRAGKLQNLRALVVGHMTDIKEGDIPFGETVIDIVRRCTSGTTYPIVFRFPSGHENPNYAWMHGANAELVVSDEIVRLTYPRIRPNT